MSVAPTVSVWSAAVPVIVGATAGVETFTDGGVVGGRRAEGAALVAQRERRRRRRVRRPGRGRERPARRVRWRSRSPSRSACRRRRKRSGPKAAPSASVPAPGQRDRQRVARARIGVADRDVGERRVGRAHRQRLVGGRSRDRRGHGRRRDIHRVASSVAGAPKALLASLSANVVVADASGVPAAGVNTSASSSLAIALAEPVSV